MNRRESIKTLMLSSGIVFIAPILQACSKKPKTILLVSGWQDINIGDITHTPGLLHVLETFLPDTKIILWKWRSSDEKVKALLKNNFPKVQIIWGNPEAKQEFDSPEVIAAFDEADIMIHGSGPSIVGQQNLECWVERTQKPFGIFGTTIGSVNEKLKILLAKASFIFTRETASIEVLKQAGLQGTHISFSPDATFFFNIHDETAAIPFLEKNGLEPRKFICVIPRLRVTPYYKLRPNESSGWSEERIQQVEELNNRCKEVDHAKMREAMIAWVRETGNKVLVCPEMTYQTEIMDELLIDPLPENVKPMVIKRGYWLPDEAASVYARAHTVLSFECHSPIIAAANGTPFFYLRQPEDTIKGQMYYDLHFNDWIFEIEQTEGKQIADRLREIWNDYPKAQAKVRDEMEQIGKIYQNDCQQVSQLL